MGWAEHRMVLEPTARWGTFALRSNRARGPVGDTLVTYRVVQEGRATGRAVLHAEHDGVPVAIADLALGASGCTERIVLCVPDWAQDLSITADDGDVRIVDLRFWALGAGPFSGLLAWRWLTRRKGGLGRWPRLLRVAAGYFRHGGVAGVRQRLLDSEATARVGARPGPGPVTAPPVARELLAQKRQELAEALHSRLEAFLEGPGRLSLPTSSGPATSVIVVCHGRAELTLACLESVASFAGSDAEVIVVDNASDDRTPDLLARADGALVLRNSSNVGFLRAVNQAAERARGEALLLLNNDACLREESLSAALTTLESDEDIGVVGTMLVLPDGTVQEAGSVVYADGICEGHGRGLSPLEPWLQCRRDVSFVSGAFLLTRRSLWTDLGGFSTEFEPAYYEDVDYCIRARQAGRRVVYEPAAVVDHFEGGSSADPQWAHRQTQQNWSVLVQRHRDWLGGQPRRGDPAHQVRTSDRRPRALVIDDRVPIPRLGSGAPRVASLVRALENLGQAVTFYAKLPLDGSWPEVRAALGPTVEVAGCDGFAGLEALLRDGAGSWRTIIVSRDHNAGKVARVLGRNRSALVGAVVVYDAEAVAANRLVARHAVLGPPLGPTEATALVARELRVAQFADRVIAVSEAEAELFRRHCSVETRVVGHGVAVNPTEPGFHDRHGLLFVGNLSEDGSPNVDGLLWFIEHVLPRFRHLLAEAGQGPRDGLLTVVGRTTALTLLSRTQPGVRFAGELDDLSGVLGAARVFVAPTRFAAGIPLKVIEAAARGLPAVTTELLADQLGWEHGDALLAAPADGDRFAHECARLYLDADLWQRVRERALRRVEEGHSPGTMQSRLAQVIAPRGQVLPT
ncbi:MAG: glycosyltransferase [Actinomycetota bacterium]